MPPFIFWGALTPVSVGPPSVLSELGDEQNTLFHSYLFFSLQIKYTFLDMLYSVNSLPECLVKSNNLAPKSLLWFQLK